MGYRIFFVQDEELYRISQKRFNALYLKKNESLPAFANQTVTSVLVIYELVLRKPKSIVRIDTYKIRFDNNGFVDEAYEHEGMQLVAEKMNKFFCIPRSNNGAEKSECSGKSHGTVVEASERFNERRWSQRHPELSGPLLKRVLADVFGPAKRIPRDSLL